MQISKRAIANVFYINILGLCSINLDAAAITGTINLGASVGVSATTVDFYSNPGTACGTPGVGIGCFSVNSPRTGSFSIFPFGSSTDYSIQDLVGGPVTGVISPILQSFMGFRELVPNPLTTITFDLIRILPGGGPACDPLQGANGNYSCTPTGSPFLLQNSSDGKNAAIFFNVEVLAYQGLQSTGTSSYSGAFSTQKPLSNIGSILTTIGTPGGVVEASYSATFVGSPDTVVPEPGTLGTLGLGLAALAFGAFRRGSRSKS